VIFVYNFDSGENFFSGKLFLQIVKKPQKSQKLEAAKILYHTVDRFRHKRYNLEESKKKLISPSGASRNDTHHWQYNK